MSNDDYHYIDKEELERQPLIPCSDTPEEALYKGISDLVNYTVSVGLPEEAADKVLRRIIDDRAQKTRAKFILHTRPPEPRS